LDPDALRGYFNAVQPGAPTAATIGSRSDLDMVKGQKGFGSLVRYGSLIGVLESVPGARDEQRGTIHDMLGAMSHASDGAFYLLGSGSSGTAPSVSFELVVPKAAIGDASDAIAYVLKNPPQSKQRAHTKPHGKG